MRPDEIRKLLGGYATGTLTETERNLLYSAALEDQELFDALADEEVLRAFLAEPATRQSLIEELHGQPGLDAWLAEDRRAPANLPAHPAQAPLQPVPSGLRTVARPFWSHLWHDLTPRRLAVAGGVALVLLIAGGIRHVQSHRQETAKVAMVNPATNPPLERTPLPAGERAAAQMSARDQEPAPRRMPAIPQSADARLSDAGQAKQKLAQTGSVELDRAKSRNDENRVAVAPAGARDSAGPEQIAEKERADAGAAREELNQAVRQQAAQERSKENVSVESSAAPVATLSAPPPSSGSLPVRPSPPATPSQIVVGGLTRASAPPPPARKAAGFVGQLRQIEAKVTDVNGTIVSINVGSNEGFHAGDVVEIVRDNRVIATSKLSQVGSTFAVGPLQLAAGGSDTPHTGDIARHAAAFQPQR